VILNIYIVPILKLRLEDISFSKESTELNTCLCTHNYVCWPPQWSNGQSSWLQIQKSGFDSRHYQIFWEVVGLKQGPLSLLNTIEELLGRKSSGFGIENREYGHRDPSRWPRGTLYPQKLALTSSTSGALSVGIVRWQTEATATSMQCRGQERCTSTSNHPCLCDIVHN
jgi:hypothetical protein